MNEAGRPLAAVLVPPGETSVLPSVFRAWFTATGVHGRYLLLEVMPEDLEQVIAALPKAGFMGLHVAPAYQHQIMDVVDIITDRAALMSGVNTIIFRKDGKFHGDNTDGYGFIENLRQSVPDWNPKAGPAAIYGAGRAARVVVTALMEVGVEEIRIASRNRPKAEMLRHEFGSRIKVFDWLKAGNLADGAGLVVNATPLGREGMSEFRVPMDGLAPGAVACDLTINPPDTRFLRQSAAYGCRVADGVGMLLYQAAPSFERWFGQRPPVDDNIRQALMT
ncbi:shikimate dehydrogenase family protein [Maritimibacter dapengensis]|uniref:shikimate dehydrogenase (NADP(+)) n=1 Tax=Maritimibacter dapengensis TaxID=2836868 RepID=A0ABS6T6C1_9RHOB|nr:shikimate dehydrogenase [Maritimibacter dapengensis]MBV7380081.1 shikimate dehydrogenase [Maritimibacter dapengensis]